MTKAMWQQSDPRLTRTSSCSRETLREPVDSSSTSSMVPEDGALPGLSVLLDRNRLTEVLENQGLQGLAAGLRVEYVRYKPGTNCLVLYSCRDETGERQFFHLKTYAEGVAPRPGRNLSRCRWFSDWRLLWVPFPVDLRLPALRMAFSEKGTQEILERLIWEKRRERFRPGWGDWSLVRYKPERRCVLKGIYQDRQRPEGPDRGYYLRFYATPRSPVLASWYSHFSQPGTTRVKVPRFIAFSRGLRVLLLKELRGVPLLELLDDPGGDLTDIVSAVAETLSAWHATARPAGVQDVHFADPRGSLFPRQLDRWLGAQTGGLEDLWRQAVELRPEPAPRPCLLHGDFYHDQIIVKSGLEVRLLDLDNLAVGDPAADVANFCAHLQLLAALGRISEDRSRHAAAVFVGAYEESAGIRFQPERLEWQRAVSLLRLVPWPFRLFRANWPELTLRLLEAAREALEGSK